MPPGWKYRVAVLAKELVLLGKSGASAYTQDDKENVMHLLNEETDNRLNGPEVSGRRSDQEGERPPP